MGRAKLVWVTPEAESVMGYCARVSNPKNQDNPDVEKLIAYCVRNQHWSIFEMANMVCEINTTRAIAQQILRHRSFTFQEFSQRYAETQGFEDIEIRRQDQKNRQNSIDDLDPETKAWFDDEYEGLLTHANTLYEDCLKRGIAKECARFVLPLSTKTKLYMNGTVRSWIHYLALRTGHGTQKEHCEIARSIQEIFREQFPTITKALEW
ncbi:MAG: FAD-dependent thymidylate synthase [Planctomycetota bacterium]|jgi:thymidylate synthase (FAD)